jgi:uncharacterized membrane protein YgaE (UPF0421/DUF939 family)
LFVKETYGLSSEKCKQLYFPRRKDSLDEEYEQIEETKESINYERINKSSKFGSKSLKDSFKSMIALKNNNGLSFDDKED